MKKEEAVKATGYTENELIYLGIIAIKVRMKEARNNATDNESWYHYDKLVKAYQALEMEYEAKT